MLMNVNWKEEEWKIICTNENLSTFGHFVFVNEKRKKHEKFVSNANRINFANGFFLLYFKNTIKKCKREKKERQVFRRESD